MKPAPFRYLRAGSVAEALSALAASGGEARLLAGGQSLVPAMNFRIARPALLVDINAIPGLDGIQAMDGGGLALGALVRHTDLARSPLVAERAPLLAEAARHIGHRAIRNRGTLGGSLAHADPAAELPAAVVALGAEPRLAGPGGERGVAADAFFRGALLTALEPDEMLVELRLPAPALAWGFAELARRPGDYALAGVAAVFAGGAPPRARLVAFGAGPQPLRLPSAEHVLGDAVERVGAGGGLDAETARRAGAAAGADVDPPSDVHASADYRRHLVAVLTERALLGAFDRLRAGRRP
jgi:aerobic carbon-monoxide dehydrogenase medium subunit